jgi:hypothetical protein
MTEAQGLHIQELLDGIRRRVGLPTPSSLSQDPALIDALNAAATPRASEDGSTAVGGAVVEFDRGGKHYTVSLVDIATRFEVGSLYMTQAFNPQLNPDIRIFGLPEPIIQWLLYTSASQMRPGEYWYFLNINGDASVLSDYINDTNAPSTLTGGGWPQSGGLGGNSVTKFVGFVIPVAAYKLFTVHLDNQSNQTGSLQLYGSYAANPGTPPTGWAAIGSAVSVTAGTDGVASVDLTQNLYLYVVAVVTFTTAPTTGSFRLIPLSKRV